jgi:hypothetical protein
MRGTFQNAGQMASIAFFFSVLTAGLASSLPTVMYSGLTANGLPSSLSHQIAGLPPIGVLFAAFLGFNPMQSLVPAGVAHTLSAHTRATIFGKSFFPHLILPAFMDGLRVAFYVAAALSLVAAVASLLRGARYTHEEHADIDAAALSARAAGNTVATAEMRLPIADNEFIHLHLRHQKSDSYNPFEPHDPVTETPIMGQGGMLTRSPRPVRRSCMGWCGTPGTHAKA